MSRTVREVLEGRGRVDPMTVAARVDGQVVDLHTPLAEDAKEVEPLAAGHPDALAVIRHSSAHVMADAVQRLFPGTQVTFGPATDTGFYYDFDRPQGAFSDEDLHQIEQKMAEIIAADHPFLREVVSKDQAKKLLEGLGEKYKLEHLERLQDPISLYRHGQWVDLCKGPHVPSTRFLQAFKLTSVSGAYWRGDERNPMLQRIHGTAFASEAELKKYLEQVEEAKKRDHRKLGKELELVAFHPWAPASPFFLPRGTSVYNRLIDYVRDLYVRYGYQEVITPQVFDTELFKKSGHIPTYAENMFLAFTAEDVERWAKALGEKGTLSAQAVEAELREATRVAIKPMNCPGHCALFGMTRRSYRELPFRMADFGRLHRFERSGVVAGLTRVRTFAQDDAHIFCTQEQAQDEIGKFIDLLGEVYRDFGFDWRVVVATRPDQRLGEDASWDRAEAVLTSAVTEKGLAFDVAEGEGAFYGPKLEFHLKDALGRPWQLGTIQFDFNLPERFDLSYVGPDNAAHRPVMLHRAVLGSVERFFGILLEHVGGAFPTWLAPEQLTLLTVSDKYNDYAQQVQTELLASGIRTTTDLSSDKLGAKIRAARLMRVPYLGVVGQKEMDGRGLALRSRDEDKDLGLLPVAEVIARIRQESIPLSRRKQS